MSEELVGKSLEKLHPLRFTDAGCRKYPAYRGETLQPAVRISGIYSPMASIICQDKISAIIVRGIDIAILYPLIPLLSKSIATSARVTQLFSKNIKYKSNSVFWYVTSVCRHLINLLHTHLSQCRIRSIEQPKTRGGLWSKPRTKFHIILGIVKLTPVGSILPKQGCQGATSAYISQGFGYQQRIK